MYSLVVYLIKPKTDRTTWVAELNKDSQLVSWQFIQATTLEHAEAKACGVYQEASYVNGIMV